MKKIKIKIGLCFKIGLFQIDGKALNEKTQFI